MILDLDDLLADALIQTADATDAHAEVAFGLVWTGHLVRTLWQVVEKMR